jgi:hypothetical protein
MGEPEPPLRNRHPADELWEVRNEIRKLEDRAGKLRAKLLTMPECERRGEEYHANVVSYQQNRLNTKKLRLELGPEFLKPSMSKRAVQCVSVRKNINDD